MNSISNTHHVQKKSFPNIGTYKNLLSNMSGDGLTKELIALSQAYWYVEEEELEQKKLALRQERAGRELSKRGGAENVSQSTHARVAELV